MIPASPTSIQPGDFWSHAVSWEPLRPEGYRAQASNMGQLAFGTGPTVLDLIAVADIQPILGAKGPNSVLD